jgi:hypothetical protein
MGLLYLYLSIRSTCDTLEGKSSRKTVTYTSLVLAIRSHSLLSAHFTSHTVHLFLLFSSLLTSKDKTEPHSKFRSAQNEKYPAQKNGKFLLKRTTAVREVGTKFLTSSSESDQKQLNNFHPPPPPPIKAKLLRSAASDISARDARTKQVASSSISNIHKQI